MGRKQVTEATRVLDVTSQSTDIGGNQSVVEQLDIISYDVDWANGSSLNAKLYIQYRNSILEAWKHLPVPDMPMSGASGSYKVDISDVNYKYARPYIEFTAGACDIVASVKCTTIGA